MSVAFYQGRNDRIVGTVIDLYTPGLQIENMNVFNGDLKAPCRDSTWVSGPHIVATNGTRADIVKVFGEWKLITPFV